MIRKRYRVLVLAVIVAAIAVPLGFALSLESSPTVVVAPQGGDIGIVAASAKTTGLLLAAPPRSHSPLPSVPDGAKLFFVGSALFGLAGVMRRTH